ncbi:monovalent cation:proton antiporter-2 (CPA2) family protein [Moraxella osloensis]|uniref:Glutathione-regulated potassium-efflux system protein KefB n=1 Tax=Faucicola osloensis TaxID=34062 RepID=A0A2D2LTK8_FAUOS|nr:monovalent cation:proton antiporter-2 (CPA2) family protein [Moraxella osloensis]ATR78368.1 glutathione-regulated potassium-efflux system protein KefB [Moraxella osloensis]
MFVLAASFNSSMMLDATIFLGAAVILIPLAKRFGIATVLGYLFTGLLLGPSFLKVASNPDDLLNFSEFGVVLLLFIIGLELQPSRLWALRQQIFVLGGLQVIVTGVVLMLLSWYFLDIRLSNSFVIGFGLALSSTAFVLQLLGEKKQLATTHGQQAFTILLFQDIAVIPLLAALPFLSGAQEQNYDWIYFAKVISVFAGLIFVSRFMVRPFFKFVASSNVTELLTATALFIILSVSLLMNYIGLSMALGAFLTGVLLADSEYRHELQASIEPFKGLLLGLFFMSVGMLTNVKLIVAKPLLIIGLAGLLMLIKFIVLTIIARLMGNKNESSIRLGVTLAQGGEFAFVLFSVATAQHLLTREQQNILNLVVTVSMAMTPLAFLLLEKIGNPLFAKATPSKEYDKIPNHEHAVVIAGFGRVGQIIGRVLRMHNIEFTAIEKSANQVDFVRKFGNQVYYGNPKNPEILRAAGLENAKVFIIAIGDIELSETVAAYVVRNYPHLTILARAKNREHYYRLRDVGVKYIWRETYLTSLDMSRETLEILGMDPKTARKTVQMFRDYDDALIERQRAIYQDEAALIASTQSAIQELESLFDSDMTTAKHELNKEKERLEKLADESYSQTKK